MVKCSWILLLALAVIVVDAKIYKYRIAYRSELRCCNGWIPAGGSACQPVCYGSTTCLNGGTCTSPNVCSCRQGYYSPHCDACASIANCQTTTCTTSSDQYCTLCEVGLYPSQDGKQCVLDENPHLQNVALSGPHIEWANNGQGDHPVGFYFYCTFSYDNPTQDPSLRFNVTFKSLDGATINVINNDVISADQRHAILDGEDLTGYLGTSIFCEVATFSVSGTNVSTFAKLSEEPYYVGIKGPDSPINIINEGVYDLYLTATIPVLCKKDIMHTYPEFCTSLAGVSISMMAEVVDNMILPYCSITLPANTWTSNEITTLKPVKVTTKLSPDYTNGTAFAEFNRIAEPYWQAWFNYIPPPVKLQFNLVQREIQNEEIMQKSRDAEMMTSPQKCGCVRENDHQVITCHSPPV